MGNALERDIQPGEEVVIARHIFYGRVPLAGRVFTCLEGDGMLASSSGREIYGLWPTGRRGKIYGFWIDKEETITWHKKE